PSSCHLATITSLLSRAARPSRVLGPPNLPPSPPPPPFPPPFPSSTLFQSSSRACESALPGLGVRQIFPPRPRRPAFPVRGPPCGCRTGPRARVSRLFQG